MLPSLHNLLMQSDAQTVLSQLGIMRSPSLDLIAELARRISGHDAACIGVMDSQWVTPLGLSKCKLEPFRRMIKDRTQNQDYHYSADFAERFPESELVNGTQLNLQSAGFFRLTIAAETIGGLAVYAYNRRVGLDPTKVAALKKLAYVSSELIRSKAELKLTLGNVFAMANR